MSETWKLDVMATPLVRSTPSGTRAVIAPPSASELVRVSSPSESDRRGSPCPSGSAFIACSSWAVPQAPAATTTCAAVTVRSPARRRPHEPLRTVVTAYPCSGAAGSSGRTRVTVRSGSMVTPRRSASAR